MQNRIREEWATRLSQLNKLVRSRDGLALSSLAIILIMLLLSPGLLTVEATRVGSIVCQILLALLGIYVSVSDAPRKRALFFGTLFVVITCGALFLDRVNDEVREAEESYGDLIVKIRAQEMLAALRDQKLATQQLQSAIESYLTKPQDPSTRGDLNADLEFIFYGHEALRFTLLNSSNLSSGREPWVFFGLMDMSNPFPFSLSREHDPKVMSPLPIPGKIIRSEYARPGTTTGRYEVLTELAKAHVKHGDRIWGFATLTCENCIKTRRYYVYWVMGEGGWYAEIPDSMPLKLPAISPPGPVSDAELQSFIQQSLPSSTARKPILGRLP